MKIRGQGAIEYLLIIVAVVLVVALVVYTITSVTNSGGNDANNAQMFQQKQTNTLKCRLDLNALNGCTTGALKTTCNCCINTSLADKNKIPGCN